MRRALLARVSASLRIEGLGSVALRTTTLFPRLQTELPHLHEEMALRALKPRRKGTNADSMVKAAADLSF